ncbi:MAG: hypothetical protein M3065_18105 [Actinomycetota bacterium]|nr:hypothetical protein [Actinomycetota bacterium]
MKQVNHTKHSMKMMRGCVAFAALAIVLVLGGVGGGAFFLIPCVADDGRDDVDDDGRSRQLPWSRRREVAKSVICARSRR